MQKTKSFWTPRNEQRLIMWYERFNGKPNVFRLVASKMKTSKSTVYHKLGRLGELDASWSKSYR